MGVRIPKALIDQYNLNEGEIELQAEDNGILISPRKKSREGWDERFSKAVKKGQTKKEKEHINIQNEFDKTEWTW